jgi:hypothetical protein
VSRRWAITSKVRPVTISLPPSPQVERRLVIVAVTSIALASVLPAGSNVAGARRNARRGASRPDLGYAAIDDIAGACAAGEQQGNGGKRKEGLEAGHGDAIPSH